MKLLLYYRKNSEHSRLMEEFMTNFQRRYPGHEIEIIDQDSQQAAEATSVYGIVDFPAMMAVSNDGSVLKDWQGTQMPLIDEVASYLS